MPFPSARCQTCKIRRIKVDISWRLAELADPHPQCDGAQPACQRCVKSQRPCQSRAAGAWSVIHIENSFASGQKKRPRGPRSIPGLEFPKGLEPAAQPLYIDLKAQAIAYYVQNHLQTLDETPEILKGVLDDFWPIWMSRAKYRMLDLAVSCMALAVFSQTQQHPPAAIEASKKYHELLQIMQTELLFLNEGTVDAYLLAIFFMGRYESAVLHPGYLDLQTLFTMTSQSFLHHDGALAMLENWKNHLSHSQPATDIIKHTRRGLIRSALLRNLAVPGWMHEGASFGEYGLGLELDDILVRIANVRQRLFTLLKKKTGPQPISHELTFSAVELGEDIESIAKLLQDWTAHFPGCWRRQEHTLSNFDLWPTRDFYSPTVYSYSSPAYAAVWNQYFATRLLLTSTHLRVLDLSHPVTEDLDSEQSLQCYSGMRATANDMVSSLPFSLLRFKVTRDPKSSSQQDLITLNTNEELRPYIAALAIWPLSIASSLRYMDPEQKSWVAAGLAHLGRVLGLKLFEYAGTKEWMEL